MTGRYLTDLDAVARLAGLDVGVVPDWQHRSRSTGGYLPGRPDHVMVHHTASPSSWNGARDVDYLARGSKDAPLANLYVGRTGRVTVIAAGATNTNGRGSAPWTDRVPDNAMNVHAIGIECGNAGTGEPWPKAQTDALVKLVRALCTRYTIPVGRVRGHCEWAPGRKIDPAGPSPWAHAGTWDMDAFRATVESVTPVRDDDDVPMFAARNADTGAVHVIHGVWRRHVPADAIAVVLNSHHGVGSPILDLATGRPCRTPGDIRPVPPAMIEQMGHNVRG